MLRPAWASASTDALCIACDRTALLDAAPTPSSRLLAVSEGNLPDATAPLPNFVGPDTSIDPTLLWTNYGVSVALVLLGVAFVALQTPMGLMFYSVATMVWLFASVLKSPSIVYALRYAGDLLLVNVANRLRSKLTPQWFSTAS